MRGLWRRAVSWWRRRGAGAPRSRVAVPSAVDFPVDVLRELRLLDPMLDAYVFPDGRVWLLCLTPERGRIQTARRVLEVDRANGELPLVQTQLAAAGFEYWGEFSWQQGTSAGVLLAVASRIIRATGAELRKAERDMRAWADGSTRLAHARQTVIDRIRASRGTDYRFAYAGRKSFARVM